MADRGERHVPMKSVDDLLWLQVKEPQTASKQTSRSYKGPRMYSPNWLQRLCQDLHSRLYLPELQDNKSLLF